ncbi:MAG: MFS transporter [Acidimicrobiales bacterium]|nr:MFS transporter [Acidimicrobiales bacterium]
MTVTAGELFRDRAVVAALATTLAATAAAVTQVTALGILVYDLTRRDLDLGFLGLAEFLPAIALVLVTGSVADRFDRRRIISVGLVGEMACSAGLAALAFRGNTSTAPIFALVVAFGVARAFLAPATRSLSPDNAPPGGLPRLVAFNSATWQVALIGGPVLAGVLYVVGPAWPFVACMGFAAIGAVVVSFTRPTEHDRPVDVAGPPSVDDPASGALVDLADEARPAEVLDRQGEAEAARVRPGGDAEEGTGAHDGPPVQRAPITPQGRLRQAAEGLVVIRRRPILLGAISLDLFAVLFGGAVALLPAIAQTRLGVGAVGLGWLRAAGGIGAAAMTLWLTIRPVRRHVGRTMFAMVALFGVGTIALGLTTVYAVAFVAMLVLSAADAVSVFIRSTIVPLVTPPEARGRVLAVEGVFVGASNELGAFESGVAGALLGTAAAVVTGGAATLVVVGIWMLAFPALRRIDRFSDLRTTPPDPP